MATQNLDILIRVEGAKQGAAEITSISRSTEHVGKQTEEASKKTSQLRRTMGTLATGFAVYKGAQWIKGAVTETTALAKSTIGLQRITGMDTKTASAWVAIAKERGVQSKALNMGFITLAKNTELLAQKSKGAVEAFHQLGISASSWAHMNTQQRMLALADAFTKMKDPAERAALAQKLFGRQAQTMLPLLTQGRAALQGQISAMGNATGETSKSVKEQLKLVKAQREMNAAMLSLKIAVATALMPILLSLTQALAPIALAFAHLMQGSTAFRIAVTALTAGLVAFLAMSRLVTIGLITLETASGIGIFIALATAFILLYQKCKLFRDIVQAVWTWIKTHWPLLLAILIGPIGIAVLEIVKHWKQIKEGIAAVWNWIKANWPLLLSILLGPIAVAVLQIVKHWKDVKAGAETAFNAIKGVVETVAHVISSVFGTALHGILDVIEKIIGAINKMIEVAGKIAKGTIGKVVSAASGLAGGISEGAGAVASLVGQTGVYASHPGFAIVGEHGPEMVHLPGGAQVQPFMQSRGRGGHGVVQVPVYLDRRQIALAMGSYVADQQAAR